MSRTERRINPDSWPILVGVIGIGVSCALLKDPPDLSASSDLDDLFDVGSFDEATGTITEGGAVAGAWEGSCDVYGYPYNIELNLEGGGATITGDGTFSTGWNTFSGTVTGQQVAETIEMVLDVDYYGYPLFLEMDGEFSTGATIDGNCVLSYGSTGALRLARVLD